ncbi:CbtB domain-containing protein [Micromonospora sp. CPCC 206061]|uniref:CbtB domain-containing protein n=1 Tax=Micromonospora sp. CPCC 206061 TaxID=3122410 RepID=UPI002FEFE7F5
MSSPAPSTSVAPIRVPVFAWLLVAVALGVIYVLLQLSGTAFAEQLHEFTHDGRHALGVPCH